MKREAARDFVILGLLLWLLYRRQGTTTDVILRDANGNPIDSTAHPLPPVAIDPQTNEPITSPMPDVPVSDSYLAWLDSSQQSYWM